jgi:hypothetical protein
MRQTTGLFFQKRESLQKEGLLRKKKLRKTSQSKTKLYIQLIRLFNCYGY